MDKRINGAITLFFEIDKDNMIKKLMMNLYRNLY